MNVFDLSAKITMDINGYLKGMNTAQAVALSTFSVVGSAISGFMDDSIETGKNFDSSMSQVAATMGKSMDEMATETGHADTAFGEFDGTLREFAQYMGRNTAFTASQAADALNYMALAGYDTQESMDMLPNVLSLAAAGNMDLARASDMVTDTQTAFGINSKRTTKLVDEMAKAASTGNTSVEQLGDAFLVVGGLAQELNGGMVTLADGTQAPVDGIQELEIALTAMANAGVKGSEAGTHMRNMLLKLASPTSDGTKRLEEMGVAVFDTEGNMRSLSDVFGDLNDSLSTMTQEEKIQAISDLFNTRDLASAEALLNAVSEDWDEIGASILDSQGAAEKMAETQLDNLAGDTKLFESALEGLQIALSDAATPALRKMKQTGTASISALTEAFQSLPPQAQTAIAMIGNFGGKALSVAPQILGLAGNVGQISTAMQTAGVNAGSFASLLNPVTAGIALTTAAIGVAVSTWTNYKQRIAEAAAEQKAFADSVSNSGEAYTATHEQISVLVSGQNDYLSVSERINQLESMRIQVANEQIAAQNDLNNAQTQLNATTESLTIAQQELNAANADGGWNFKMTTEEIEGMKLQQEYLTTAMDEATATYDQTTTDLDEINAALEELYAEQEAQQNAVNDTTSAYANFAAEIPDDMIESASTIVGAVLNVSDAMSNSIKSIGNWFDEVKEKEKQSATDMKKNLQEQIEAVKSWEKDLDYLADKGINKEFLTYLANMGPEASEYVAAMKEDILAGGQDTVDEWNSLYQEKLDLESGINTEAQNVYDAIISMEAGSEEAFSELTEAFNLGGYNAGENITLGLIDGLDSKLTEIAEAAEETGESAIDALDEGAGVESPSWKAEDTGEYIGEGLINGLENESKDVYDAGSGLGSQAISGLDSANLYDSARTLGYWFDMGLMSGISDYAGNVANAAWSVAQNAVNTVKNTMRIGSPSKIANYFGEMWDKGLELGITDNADGPITAMRNMTNDIIDEADVGIADDLYPEYETYESEDTGGINVTMNIYGSEGQDVRELANIVSQELALIFQERQAVWA